MSDDPDLEDLKRVLVFVSDEGRTVGVGREKDGQYMGVCLAYLDTPVSIDTWLAVLRDTDPEEAADALVARFGGIRLCHVTVLHAATILPPLAGGPVGEA